MVKEQVRIGAGVTEVTEIVTEKPLVRIPLTIGVKLDGLNTHMLIRVNLVLKHKLQLPVLIE